MKKKSNNSVLHLQVWHLLRTTGQNEAAPLGLFHLDLFYICLMKWQFWHLDLLTQIESIQPWLMCSKHNTPDSHWLLVLCFSEDRCDRFCGSICIFMCTWWRCEQLRETGAWPGVDFHALLVEAVWSLTCSFRFHMWLTFALKHQPDLLAFWNGCKHEHCFISSYMVVFKGGVKSFLKLSKTL